jgi:hypothetical protein
MTGLGPLDPLATDARWVAWRTELRGEPPKPTKVPYAATGGRAKADDPRTWAPRSEAERRAARIVNGLGGGVGIVLGDLGTDMHLAGIDLDSCLDADGTIAPWAMEILSATGSYAEISPSGTGIKVYFYVATEDARSFLDRIGAEPDTWGTRRDAPGADGRDHGPAVEIYLSHRYFAVTGDRWGGAPDTIRLLEPDALERLALQIPPKRGGGATGNNADNSRSAIAFRKGAALRRAGKTFDEMVAALRADPDTAAWCREKGTAAGGRELRRIWDKAETCATEDGSAVSLNDFYAFMPMHNYIYTPSRATWPGASVNARIPPITLTNEKGEPVVDGDGKPVVLSASAWLDRFKPVEQMIWAPGMPMIVRDKIMFEGGWIERSGVGAFNLYHPPTIKPGDPAEVGRWRDHVRFVYPDDAEHIFDWLAQRAQRPAEKINHALVLGGDQGIGKDSLLAPAKHVVGPWNFKEVSPTQILGRFNEFLRSVILRINEARDLGDSDRFKFYDHMKAYTASPPETLRVDEKFLREYPVLNCCGIIITTNHQDGIFLPPEDRRHYVAWSHTHKEDPHFAGSYWNDLWAWYENGGFEHVTAWLLARDLGGFDAKAPPPKTPAFWTIVDSNRSPEEPELADLIEALDTPDALTLAKLQDVAELRFASGLSSWLNDRANRRVIPHRLERCGYVPVRNPDANDGMWKLTGRRQAVYAKTSLSMAAQIAAARQLQRLPGQSGL